MAVTGARPRLTVDLTSPEPIPEAGIRRAAQLMRTGRLFRYGEERSEDSEASALEAEFAAIVGRRHAAAVSSCGSALFLALRCVGVRPGDEVLMNAFTLAPVPGAIAHAAARATLVEITDDLTIDLDDLERKAVPGRVLLLSHMRGHVSDMDAVVAICERHGMTLIEDCAHTLGATWAGRPTGTFGVIGCFSTQTFKHLNSGEGGFLTSDDDEIAATAILSSGSYALYAQHGARPDISVFERLRNTVPNFSLRMSALEAAILRPQLALLPTRIRAWNDRYAAIEQRLNSVARVRVPRVAERHGIVGSSIQFLLDLEPNQIAAVVCGCGDRGLHVKWFGNPDPLGFTSTFRHWAYLNDHPDAPRTAGILARLCDLRVSTALSLDDCRLIGDIIEEAIREAVRG